MNTKKLPSRKVHRKRISYKEMAEMLLGLQVEVHLLADTEPENDKCITATNFTTDNSVLFQFETDEFFLSFDLVGKEVHHAH